MLEVEGVEMKEVWSKADIQSTGRGGKEGRQEGGKEGKKEGGWIYNTKAMRMRM